MLRIFTNPRVDGVSDGLVYRPRMPKQRVKSLAACMTLAIPSLGRLGPEPPRAVSHNPQRHAKMILTNCACCAVPLPHLAKQCSRCKTRYCGPACQKQHWDAGGHNRELCKRIKKAGGAEQYNADKKFKEAVAIAVESCAESWRTADDIKGQVCYICTEAVHRRTGEGLVRGCACGDRDGFASGIMGIAHVSCLAEQAKILVAEADENNLDDDEFYV